MTYEVLKMVNASDRMVHVTVPDWPNLDYRLNAASEHYYSFLMTHLGFVGTLSPNLTELREQYGGKIFDSFSLSVELSKIRLYGGGGSFVIGVIF